MRHARTYDAPISLAVLARAAAQVDAPPEVLVGDATLPAGELLHPGDDRLRGRDGRRALPADRPGAPSGWSGWEPGAFR